MKTLEQYNLCDANAKSVRIGDVQHLVKLHQSFNKRGWKIRSIEFYDLDGADFESKSLAIKKLHLFPSVMKIVRIDAIKENKKANCDIDSTFGADRFRTDFEDYTLISENRHYYNEYGDRQY